MDATSSMDSVLLPDCVLSRILLLEPTSASHRLVSKQFRRCKDAPLTTMTIKGMEFGRIEADHFARAQQALTQLTQHSKALTCLVITHLPSFGPLSAGLPKCLLISQQLKTLKLHDIDRLVSGGDASLAFHLRGISSLVNLEEFHMTGYVSQITGIGSLGLWNHVTRARPCVAGMDSFVGCCAGDIGLFAATLEKPRH